MAAETRIKLTNIITKIPEEAVDSLCETACKMFKTIRMMKNHVVHSAVGKQSYAMVISAVSRNIAVKTVGKLLSPQQIP